MTDDTLMTSWSESATVGQFTVTREYPSPGDMTAVEFVLSVQRLVDKAGKLVALLDDMEKNHGGLVGTKTYRGRDDLRLELSRWK